jgi:hypothetical protein
VTTSQILVAAFIAGTVLYAFGPDVVSGIRRRVAAWWRPQMRLAKYSPYQDIDR